MEINTIILVTLYFATVVNNRIVLIYGEHNISIRSRIYTKILIYRLGLYEMYFVFGTQLKDALLLSLD